MCFRHSQTKQNHRLVSWNGSLAYCIKILYFTNEDVKAKRIKMLCLKFTLCWCRSKPRLPVQHLDHSTLITLYPASSLSPLAGLSTHPYFFLLWASLRIEFKIPETFLLDDRMWKGQVNQNLGTTQHFSLPQAVFTVKLLYWHLSQDHSFCLKARLSSQSPSDLL